MKKIYKSLSILTGALLFAGTVSAQTYACTESASASGTDASGTTAAITSIACTPSSNTVTSVTLDATIGSWCGSWYSYDIIVNGTSVAIDQCDQTGFDLTPYIPVTSVSIVAHDDDNWTDNITLNLDVTTNSTFDPLACQPALNVVTNVIGIDSVIVTWDELQTPSGWNLEYGPSGFTQGTGTTISTTDLTDTIGGLTQLTDYDVYIQAACAVDSSLAVGPFAFTTLPNCPDVVSLSGVALSDTSIYISWASSGTETMWDYEYGATGFALGTGTSISDTNTNDTISGLMAATLYDVYFRSNCGGIDVGAWMGPVSVYTQPVNDNSCGAIELTIGTVGNYNNYGTSNTFDPGNSSNNTLWFKFTAPASGHVAIATCGTPFDTELSVFDTLSDCSDITQFNELYYADYNPYGCAGSHPAGVEMCGLIAGEEYLFKIGAYYSNDMGQFPLLIWDLQYNAGTDTTVNACLGDTVNLAQAITDSYAITGTNWDYAANPNALLDDTLAITNNFTIGSSQVLAITANSCMADTAYVTVNISQASNSGTAITPFNGCNTGDVYLNNGLAGTVDAGGTWTYDNGSSTGILSGNVFIASGLNIGQYQFTYTAGNGVCPPASTQITVDLQNCVGIEETNTSFGIYPNPNNGSFNLETELSGVITFEVLDIQGKVVYLDKMNVEAGVQTPISINNLEAGTYLVRITNNDNVTVKTLILK